LLLAEKDGMLSFGWLYWAVRCSARDAARHTLRDRRPSCSAKTAEKREEIEILAMID
jgi:hypothetical protein